MSSGYLTLATGSKVYVEQALNLALSVRLNDPDRPISLVTDKTTNIPDEYLKFFDKVLLLDEMEGYFGCLNKLRVNNVSPYCESLFIDADCIIVKNDMNRHWMKFKSHGFNIAGGKATSGHWYGFNIAKVIVDIGIPYLVRMNSGTFYFNKSADSEEFFRVANDLVKEKGEILGVHHRSRIQLADEPFIGASMGLLNLQPISYLPEEGSIMITTVNSSHVRFDPFTQESSIIKRDGYLILGRLFPTKFVKHSPSIAHFVGLKPVHVYSLISNKLRDYFHVERVEF